MAQCIFERTRQANDTTIDRIEQLHMDMPRPCTQRACALTNNQPQMLATLAGVQAAIGDAQAALATAQTALDGAIKAGDTETAEQLRAWIAQMRSQHEQVEIKHQ